MSENPSGLGRRRRIPIRRRTLAYAPVVALVAAQLLVVAIAPSKAPATSLAQVTIGGAVPNYATATPGTTAGGSVSPGTAPSIGSPVPGSTSAGPGPSAVPNASLAGAQPNGVTAPASAAPGVSGIPRSGVNGAKPTGVPKKGTASSAKPGAATASGQVDDPDLCPAGSALQQTVTLESIPCVPGFVGNNGGATAPGVTATTITIVRYHAESNAAEDSVESAAGLSQTEAQLESAENVWATYFAKHYELYGRKIIWEHYQGQCTASPPDDNCLRLEVRTIISTLHPFAVFWPFGEESFYDEMSKDGVVNLGGNTYSDTFSQQHRPYHYDVLQSGTRTAANLAGYWCAKLAGKKAIYAGDVTLRNTARKMGIIVRVSDANVAGANELAADVKACDPSQSNVPIVTFSQDTSTAATQGNAAVATLRGDGVTTVVSFSDPIELTFELASFDDQAYHPEHLLTGSNLDDADAAGQLQPTDQWQNAFGPSDLGNAVPNAQTDPYLAYADAGGTGSLYAEAAVFFAYMQQIVWSIQLAGPDLDALNIEKGLLSSPKITGGVNTYGCQWGPNDYSAIDDSRAVYWSSTAVSAENGKTGAYVPLDGGARTPVGQWSSEAPKP